jgi:hypothetical protein
MEDAPNRRAAKCAAGLLAALTLAIAAGCVTRFAGAPAAAGPAMTWNGGTGAVYFVEFADTAEPDLYRPVDGVWVPPPTSMVYRMPWPGLYRVKARGL